MNVKRTALAGIGEAEQVAAVAGSTKSRRVELGETSRLWRSFGVNEIRDERGAVVVFPDGAHIPYGFDANRVYFLFTDTPAAERGNHAHKRLRQVIVCLTGRVTVELDDGSTVESFELASPSTALEIGPLIWRRLHTFAAGTICAVFASEAYDPDDYLHTYEEFRRELLGRHNPDV